MHDWKSCVCRKVHRGFESLSLRRTESRAGGRTLRGSAVFFETRRGVAVTLVDQYGNTATGTPSTQVTLAIASGSGTTGATHLLEHLMFKGTRRFNKQQGTDIFDTDGARAGTFLLENGKRVVKREILRLLARYRASGCLSRNTSWKDSW